MRDYLNKYNFKAMTNQMCEASERSTLSPHSVSFGDIKSQQLESFNNKRSQPPKYGIQKKFLNKNSY